MGVRQTMARWIGGREFKQTQTTQAILSSGNIIARWTPNNYTSTATTGYMRNPYCYAAIRQIATAIAGIGWSVYTDESKKTKLEQHPLKKLLERPNPRMGRSQFFENVVAYLNLDGNSFIQQVGPDNKPPTELYVLRPDRMTILPGTVAEPVSGYIYAVGQVKIPLTAEAIRHFKMFHPLDDWRGLSPMAAAMMSVDQSNASKAWNVALLQNGARPPGAMSTQFNLDDEQYQRVKEMIREEYAGFMNAGRPLLLEGGLTWQEMGMSPVDMAWLEGQKLSAREIAIVYNIAPELIGDSANKTYSNYGEARVALYEENALPACDWLRDEFNAWLSPLFDDEPYLDYDKDDIEALQEDRDAMWRRAGTAFTAGFITINEARGIVQLDEDTETDWGDAYVFELPQRAPGTLPPGEEPPPPIIVAPPPPPEGLPTPGAPGAPPALPAPSGLPSGGKPSGGSPPTPQRQPAGGGSPPPAPRAPGKAGGAAKKVATPFARGRKPAPLRRLPA